MIIPRNLENRLFAVAKGRVPKQSEALQLTQKSVNLSQASIFVEQTPVIAADGAAQDLFGSSVAIDGDTLIVGAGSVSAGGNSRPGAVDVFTRSGSSWSRQQRLFAADGADGDNFGQSLAIAGETVIIGSATSNTQGAAYVFVQNGTAWSQQQKLVAADGAVNDNFGHAVALVGDTAIIGAPIGLADDWQGAAYVFTRSDTTWSQQQKLVATDGAIRDGFGMSVALVGDTALVGVPHAAGNSNPAQGAAYLFVQNDANWSQQQKLIAANDAEDSLFGWSVVLNSDTAVICSWITEDLWHGSAYVYRLCQR